MNLTGESWPNRANIAETAGLIWPPESLAEIATPNQIAMPIPMLTPIVSFPRTPLDFGRTACATTELSTNWNYFISSFFFFCTLHACIDYRHISFDDIIALGYIDFSISCPQLLRLLRWILSVFTLFRFFCHKQCFCHSARSAPLRHTISSMHIVVRLSPNGRLFSCRIYHGPRELADWER